MAILNWNRISIIHENNLYAVNGAKRLQQECEKRGICVVGSYGITTENGININEITVAINKMTDTKTTGVVFFGGSTTANAFFQDLNTKSLAQIPIVMVSEGVNMDKDAFRSFSGNVFQKAQGSFGVAPLYRQVEEFKTYWKSIFTTASNFNSSIASNPWLQDVFDELISCKQTDCRFQTIDQNTIDKYFDTQPLFLQYAILAAHVMAKTIRNYCESKPSICYGILDDFKAGDLISKTKGLTIDFENDFAWR